VRAGPDWASETIIYPADCTDPPATVDDSHSTTSSATSEQCFGDSLAISHDTSMIAIRTTANDAVLDHSKAPPPSSASHSAPSKRQSAALIRYGRQWAHETHVSLYKPTNSWKSSNHTTIVIGNFR
jgi:hypothetical protein